MDHPSPSWSVQGICLPGEIVREIFDLRPGKIISRLDLRRPIYEQTAAYGHFGRTDVDLPWERADMVEALKARAM